MKMIRLTKGDGNIDNITIYDDIDYEALGPSSVAIESYAVIAKEPNIEQERTAKSRNKTLALIIGSIRGGEAAHWTFYRHFLDLNQVDCAIIGSLQYRKLGSLYSRCKYIWEVKHFPHLSDSLALVEVGRNISPIGQWRSYQGKTLGVLYWGGSAPITLFSRWVAKQMFFKYKLHDLCDRFVITRSDHFFACDHNLSVLSNTSQIYIVQGEDYGGINDRHWICSRADVFKCLSIVDRVVLNSTPYDAIDMVSFRGNIESLIQYRLQEMRLLPRVVRFPRPMFVIKTADDDNKYSPAGGISHYDEKYIEDRFGVYPKYVFTEYWDTEKKCANDWPKRNLNTLVLILSEQKTHGNFTSWESLKSTFLNKRTHVGLAAEPDCALVYYRDTAQGFHPFPHSSGLLSLCKYIWEFPPIAEDWGNGLDTIIGHKNSSWRRNWPYVYGGIHLHDLKSHSSSSKVVGHHHRETSGDNNENNNNAAYIYLRWLTMQKVHELGLLDKYEDFIITRPSYVYETKTFNFTDTNPLNFGSYVYWGMSPNFSDTNPRHVWALQRQVPVDAYDRVYFGAAAKLLQMDWSFMRCTFMNLEYCLCLFSSVLLYPSRFDKLLHEYYMGVHRAKHPNLNYTELSSNLTVNHHPENGPSMEVLLLLRIQMDGFENHTHLLTQRNISIHRV